MINILYFLMQNTKSEQLSHELIYHLTPCMSEKEFTWILIKILTDLDLLNTYIEQYPNEKEKIIETSKEI